MYDTGDAKKNFDILGQNSFSGLIKLFLNILLKVRKYKNKLTCSHFFQNRTKNLPNSALPTRPEVFRSFFGRNENNVCNLLLRFSDLYHSAIIRKYKYFKNISPQCVEFYFETFHSTLTNCI